MGRRVGPPPSDCEACYLYFILRFWTIFTSLRTIIFAFPDYIHVFRPPLHSDLIIDFSLHSASSFPILYGLPTPRDHSCFHFPIPNTICVLIPLACDISDTSYVQETPPRPSTTFPNTALLSAPIPFPFSDTFRASPAQPLRLPDFPDTSCARLPIHPYAMDADRTANWGQLVFQWGGDDTLQDSLGRINAISDIFTTYSGYMR